MLSGGQGERGKMDKRENQTPSVHPPPLNLSRSFALTTTAHIMSSPNSTIFTPPVRQIILASHMMHTTVNINDKGRKAAQKFDNYFYHWQPRIQCFGTRKADSGRTLDIYIMRSDIICAAVQQYSQPPPTVACCLYPEADHQPYFDLCVNTTSRVAEDWVEYEGEGILWITGDSRYVSMLCHTVWVHIWSPTFCLRPHKKARKIFNGLGRAKFQGKHFLVSEFHGREPQLWSQVIV
jgi:hypothetical protein